MAQKSRSNTAGRKGGAAPRVAGTPGRQAQTPRQAPAIVAKGVGQPQRQAMAPPSNAPSQREAAPRARPATAGTEPPRRQEQRQRGRVVQRTANRGTWAAAGGGVLLVVLIVAVLLARNGTSSSGVKLHETQQPPSASGIHVAEGSVIHYDYNPPSSGPHYPSPASWGVYPQVLAPGTWVHNLEHGGIVVLYQCPTTCAALQTQMQALFTQMAPEAQFQERKLVTTPYTGLDHLIRVQAWSWTMPLDSFDTTAINAFYHEHVDKGPEQIP